MEEAATLSDECAELLWPERRVLTTEREARRVALEELVMRWHTLQGPRRGVTGRREVVDVGPQT